MLSGSSNVTLTDAVVYSLQQQYLEAVILSYIYFFGSIVSFLLLLSAFVIFSYFRYINIVLSSTVFTATITISYLLGNPNRLVA